MQIFCRETQAHLELNPHLKDKNESGGKARLLRLEFKLHTNKTDKKKSAYKNTYICIHNSSRAVSHSVISLNLTLHYTLISIMMQ